jgi:hypothetical protein
MGHRDNSWISPSDFGRFSLLKVNTFTFKSLYFQKNRCIARVRVKVMRYTLFLKGKLKAYEIALIAIKVSN